MKFLLLMVLTTSAAFASDSFLLFSRCTGNVAGTNVELKVFVAEKYYCQAAAQMESYVTYSAGGMDAMMMGAMTVMDNKYVVTSSLNGNMHGLIFAVSGQKASYTVVSGQYSRRAELSCVTPRYQVGCAL